MVQYIDVAFRDRVLSEPFNRRFLDVSGPCVLFGYRLALGSAPFTLSLLRGGYRSNVAISPSGVRVEETEDIIDKLIVTPNNDPDAVRRDSVYLVYEYGTEEAAAYYTVVPGLAGTSIPADNPDPTSHLLIGYVDVPINSGNITEESLHSVPYGFSRLRVAGDSLFNGKSTFNKEVVFNGPVTFSDGSDGSTGGGRAQIDRFPETVIAAPGQTLFTFPEGLKYSPNTKTLFVYVDWVLQPPGIIEETSETAFAFLEPLNGGEKVWAYWATNLSLQQVTPHHHDESYYTKLQIDRRSPRYYQDYFVGMSGKVITHNIGHQNYVVLGITPTSKTSELGSVSVTKGDNTITVFNSGAYRGSFDLGLMLKF